MAEKKNKKSAQTKKAAEQTDINQDTAAAQSEAETAEASQKQEQAENSDNKALAAENEKLKAEAAELKDKYLRLAAEYDNFRKRSAKEKENVYGDALADAALGFLPAVDSLERAVGFAGDNPEAFREGVAMVLKQLSDGLTKLGITEVETKDGFDPGLHNAIMHIEDDEHSKNEIIEVFQKGYQYKDRVIRHSLVKVAN